MVVSLWSKFGYSDLNSQNWFFNLIYIIRQIDDKIAVRRWLLIQNEILSRPPYLWSDFALNYHLVLIYMLPPIRIYQYPSPILSFSCII